ncbi:hypothetical protein Ate01nite_71650 [Actinoplanes teichomyceticus]|nr:hypothetical protein Ate01nite_71650 [Actinoplanes teichomyceticus]
MAAAAVAAAAGCASVGDRGAAAADVAVRMLRAAQTGDGSTACALLAPDTVAAIERSAGKPCPEAILDEDLPRPAAVTATQVYGQRAQVRLTGDTVFLGAFPGGWRVVAAGCVPRDGRPYDCTVQGA